MADETEQIKERLSIETLVGEHVALKRSGRSLMGLCPFHKEKSPSFVVSPERGSFHCFGCGVGGTVFNFYMLLHKVEFPEALRALAARTGVELDPEAARRKASEARGYDVLQAAALYFQQSLAGNAGDPARAYLAGRGITQKTIERFALGFLPDWGDGLRRALPARGVSEQELIDVGVLIAGEQGREPFSAFHGRVIYPIRDLQGRVCGFGGRILGPGQPKYLNSRQGPLFEKSSVLYTIDAAADAIRSTGEVVIVEGYMDALRAHQDGFTNVVASLGTAITVQQLALLSRLRPREAAPVRTVLALDAGPAGARAAAEAGVRAVVALRQPWQAQAPAIGKAPQAALELHIATLPDGFDPDEVIAKDPAVWRAAIAGARPVMDHLFDLVLGGLDRRLPTFAQDLLAQLLPLVGQLPGVGQQQPYLERLQAITHIDTAALRGELVSIRSAARRGQRQPPARQSEIAALRQAAQARKPVDLVEEELLSFLLHTMPLEEEALRALAGMPIRQPGRRAVLEALLAVHASGPPSALLARAALPENETLVFDQLMDLPPPPPVGAHKVVTALKVYRSRLERLAQSERLREQSELLDQVDSQAAHDLLGSARDLVASRHELNQRMLEAQAEYHLQ